MNYSVRSLKFALIVLLTAAAMSSCGNSDAEAVIELSAEAPNQAGAILAERPVEATVDFYTPWAKGSEPSLVDAVSIVTFISQYQFEAVVSGEYYYSTVVDTSDDSVCEFGYDPTEMVGLSLCDGGELGVEDPFAAQRWEGLPSSGYVSRKATRTVPTGPVPPNLGAYIIDSSQPTQSSTIQGRLSPGDLPPSLHPEDAVESVSKYESTVVVDVTTGHVLDVSSEVDGSIFLESSIEIAQSVDEKAIKASVMDLRRRVDAANPHVENFGFKRSEGRNESGLPVQLHGFELVSVYVAESADEGASVNPPSQNVRIGVYQLGVQQLIMTLRDMEPKTDSFEQVSAGSWIRNPLDPSPLSTEGEQTTALLRDTTTLTTQGPVAWGPLGDDIATIEGFLVAPDTIDLAAASIFRE